MSDEEGERCNALLDGPAIIVQPDGSMSLVLLSSAESSKRSPAWCLSNNRQSSEWAHSCEEDLRLKIAIAQVDQALRSHRFGSSAPRLYSSTSIIANQTHHLHQASSQQNTTHPLQQMSLLVHEALPNQPLNALSSLREDGDWLQRMQEIDAAVKASIERRDLPIRGSD